MFLSCICGSWFHLCNNLHAIYRVILTLFDRYETAVHRTKRPKHWCHRIGTNRKPYYRLRPTIRRIGPDLQGLEAPLAELPATFIRENISHMHLVSFLPSNLGIFLFLSPDYRQSAPELFLPVMRCLATLHCTKLTSIERSSWCKRDGTRPNKRKQ